jgi:hypothetical protein
MISCCRIWHRRSNSCLSSFPIDDKNII